MIIVVKTVLVMISLIFILIAGNGLKDNENDRTLVTLFTLSAWTFIEFIVLAILL